MSEPEQPRKRLGILRLLLISVVVVIAGSLFLVMGICGGFAFGRTPVDKKTIGLAAATFALAGLRRDKSDAAHETRTTPIRALIAAATVAAGAVLWWLL